MIRAWSCRLDPKSAIWDSELTIRIEPVKIDIRLKESLCNPFSTDPKQGTSGPVMFS